MQNAVMNYLAYNYPGTLYTHPANEGKRSPFERFKFKYLGAKAGIPDLLIFTPNANRSGLAIELKVGYNKPTPMQKEWLKRLQDANWAAFWSNDYEEVCGIIDKYFKNDL